MDGYRKAVVGFVLFGLGVLLLIGGVIASVTGTTSIKIGVDQEAPVQRVDPAEWGHGKGQPGPPGPPNLDGLRVVVESDKVSLIPTR